MISTSVARRIGFSPVPPRSASHRLTMRIIPVLDLLNGVVVRGVAGERSNYRPVVSRLVDQPEPLAVARAFRAQLGLGLLYVADLDAILHDRPSRDLYRRLAADGFDV